MDDPILFWNAVALECNRRDHTGVVAARNQRGPTLSSRALAIVHIAMHDAYVMATGGTNTYLPNPPQIPPGLDPTAAASAVAAAASVTLLNLYSYEGPEGSPLAPFINDEFARFSGVVGSHSVGHLFGLQVGRAVINLRQDDGSMADPDVAFPDYMDSAAYGHHREDPLNPGQGYLGVRYGFVRPFAISAWPPLAAPPSVTAPIQGTTDTYLSEVRYHGAAPNFPDLKRTPLQTLQGIYWAYDGVKEIGTPPRLYNQLIRELLVQRKTELNLDTGQLARLFLVVNLAMADAGIAAWFYKYHFDLWRPIVGIREYDHSMGPGATVGTGASAIDNNCDPFWRPLGAPKTNVTATDDRIRTFTPPFPAYPSGHATFGAAAFHAARLYLQQIGKATINDGTDTLGFEFTSDELNGKSIDPDDTVRTRHIRKFESLHEAIYENAASRVYLGVHWRFDATTGTDASTMLANAKDCIGGVPLGLAIANDILAQTELKPTPPDVTPIVAEKVKPEAKDQGKAKDKGKTKAGATRKVSAW